MFDSEEVMEHSAECKAVNALVDHLTDTSPLCHANCPAGQPKLETLVIAKGSHGSKEAGGCVMEWTSYLAGEPWSDHPRCVSPVIAAFLRRWNDDLGDADRQRLKPYIVRVIGTNTGPEDDERRAWMLT